MEKQEVRFIEEMIFLSVFTYYPALGHDTQAVCKI